MLGDARCLGDGFLLLLLLVVLVMLLLVMQVVILVKLFLLSRLAVQSAPFADIRHPLELVFVAPHRPLVSALTARQTGIRGGGVAGLGPWRSRQKKKKSLQSPGLELVAKRRHARLVPCASQEGFPMMAPSAHK